MGIDHDQLVYMALMVLDEIADANTEAPAHRSVVLRFTLAWLFHQCGGDPSKKWLFDSFWKEATRMGASCTDDVARRTSIQAAMNGICRACGWERDVAFMQEMARARSMAALRP